MYACGQWIFMIFLNRILHWCAGIVSGVARPKLMVGPDYRGTKEVLEDLTLAAPG